MGAIFRRQSGARVHPAIICRRHRIVPQRVRHGFQLAGRLPRLVGGPVREVQMFPALAHMPRHPPGYGRNSRIERPARFMRMTIVTRGAQRLRCWLVQFHAGQQVGFHRRVGAVHRNELQRNHHSDHHANHAQPAFPGFGRWLTHARISVGLFSGATSATRQSRNGSANFRQPASPNFISASVSRHASSRAVSAA